MVNLTLNSIRQHPDNVSGFINYINQRVDRFINESYFDITTENNIRNSVNYELGKYYCVLDRINNSVMTESVESELSNQINSINTSLNNVLLMYHINA